MMNKEIIDGVNVSEWTDEEVRYKFEKHSPKAIRQIAFDLYKQLKHKKQECEELKSDLTDLSKIIDCKNGTILTFKEQLDQLKAENDKYSFFIEKLCDYAGLECDDEEQAMRTLSDFARQMNKTRRITDRYKQTLSEIKEIAKIEYPKSLFTETFVEVINHCPYFDCGKCKCLENKEKRNCGGFICSRKQSVYYQENTIYFKQILQKISDAADEYNTKDIRHINEKNQEYIA